MKVLHSLLEIAKDGFAYPPIGITIGNFDGVHSGHLQLLKKIKKDCELNSLKFVLVSFVPHPQKILSPGKERFLINSYEQKRKLMESSGVDFFIELSFTRDFSTLAAEDFLKDYLFVYPGIKSFFLGYDFAFGANKQGGHDLVKSICEEKGIKVEIQPKFVVDEKIVSSSLIREKLISGELEYVTKVLGRPFHLEGVVVKGEGRGKKIGFPTANIQVFQDLIIPQKGVYVTRTHYENMTYESITNVGNNPTFKDSNELTVETHLFDFDVDIYGEKLDIEFLIKVRDEKKFQTVNDLIQQIKNDVQTAKKYLKNI